jgi:hypothetical protein
MAPDNFNTFIRRTAIDHNVFEVRIALIENGAQRAFQIRALLEGACDDGNQRQP